MTTTKQTLAELSIQMSTQLMKTFSILESSNHTKKAECNGGAADRH